MFKNKNFLSVKNLHIDEIDYLINLANKMLPYANRQKKTKVLDGAILANLFFEPSTRTRISFAVAFNRLGGVVNDTTGVQFSSLTKGESIYDTSKVISSYVDIITVRHPTTGVVGEFANASDVPVINGGDGVSEHPTQAMLDIYTIHKEVGQINGISIAMVGDLKYGRTVHSLSILLSLYKNITLYLISPNALKMPEYIKEDLLSKGVKIIESENLEENLQYVDIIYSTRIQEERFATPELYERYRGKYNINKKMYQKYCKPTSILMHPLPRDSRLNKPEIDNDLNDFKNLAIFRQSANGIPIRMAIFASILGVEDKF